MGVISVRHDILAIAFDSEVWWRSLSADIFNRIKIPLVGPNLKECSTENICDKNIDYAVGDITFSHTCEYLAVLASSKQLFIYSLSDGSRLVCQHRLPRAGSKVVFSPDSQQVLVADKTGDVFVYSATDSNVKGQQVLGHLSLLTDILMTPDSKVIITCDRDEKIRVSNYPGTYKIESFCLGHKEFVTSILFLPHNVEYLMSASGDGTLRLWKYLIGKEVFSIDVSEGIKDSVITKTFQSVMEKEDVKVDCLPINYISACKQFDNSSLLGVSLYSSTTIFVYQIVEDGLSLSYKLLNKISVDDTIIGFAVLPTTVLVYTSGEKVRLQQWDKEESGYLLKSTELLDNQLNCASKTAETNSITLLYKRKYDNLQEYHKRKKQRLGVD